MGEVGENYRLVGSIDAIEVQRFVRLDVAERTGIIQDLLERSSFLLHAGQEIVGGAVENAVNERKLVRDQTFTQYLDDRNTARNAGLECVADVCLFPQPRTFPDHARR